MFGISKNNKNSSSQLNRKKPPPRPPPPDFTKLKSQSTYNLSQTISRSSDLIDWSPPNSPKVERCRPFGGSVSSSFSSSTSSLASSKKSDSEPSSFVSSTWFFNNTKDNVQTYPVSSKFSKPVSNLPCMPYKSSVPSAGPTIIRAAPPKKSYRIKLEPHDASVLSSSPNLPMPNVPPPSPPKEVAEVITPYGIALYDFPATYPSDLALQVNDVVIVQRRVNDEWLYGQVADKEGMFPANFIDIVVPLPEDDRIVTALYEFKPQMSGDLALVPGQKVTVTKKLSDEWFYGESNGNVGQFPSNFVDRVPNSLF